MPRFHFPFKTLIVAGLLSFVVVENPPLKLALASDKDMVKRAEFYPLSSFSMYSTFSESPFLVYLTNKSGEVVRFDTDLKTHASETKKTYEIRLKEQKKAADLDGRLTDIPTNLKETAGLATLTLLKARSTVQDYLATQPDPTLQLHEIVLTAGPDGIIKRQQKVAEL